MNEGINKYIHKRMNQYINKCINERINSFLPSFVVQKDLPFVNRDKDTNIYE